MRTKVSERIPGFEHYAPVVNGLNAFPESAVIHCHEYFATKEYLTIPAFKGSHIQRQKVIKFLNNNGCFELEQYALDDMTVIYNKGSTGIIFTVSLQVFEIDRILIAFVANLRTEETMQKRGYASTFFENLVAYLQQELEKPYRDCYIITKADQKLNSKGFFRKIGFNKPPGFFNSWNSPLSDLLGLRINQNFKFQRAKASKPLLDQDVDMAEESKTVVANDIDSDTLSQCSRESNRTTVHHKARHCKLQGCKDKHISYGNWARHLKKFHPEVGKLYYGVDYTNCPFKSSHQCKGVENGYQGPKKSYRCTQCNINKRYDQFYRDNRSICLKCHQISIKCEDQVDKTHYGQRDQESQDDFLELSEVMVYDSISQIGEINVGSKRLHLETTIDEELQMTKSIKRQRVDEEQESVAISSQIKNLEVQPPLTVINNPQMTTTKEVEYVVISTHDQDAVTKLKSIEQGDLQEFQCAQILHKHAHLLAQDIVLNYAVQSKSQKLVDTILQVLRRGNELNDQEIIGLALVSLLRGDACLQSTVRLLNSLEISKTKEILDLLQLQLAKHFSNEIASWTICYWMHLDQQQIQLMNYIKNNKIAHQQELLTISLCVQISDLPQYTSFVVDFLDSSKSAGLIIQSIILQPRQFKMSFIEFGQTLSEIQDHKYAQLIDQIKLTLLDTPLSKWLQLLCEQLEQDALMDSESIQVFLEELMMKYGSDVGTLSQDLTKSKDEMYGILTHEVENKPNARQFALAQYCIGKLYKQQRQLWVVPSGQGKSRITATAAAIALLSGMFNKVHLVFDNSQLLQRDKQDFDDYWIMLGYDDNQVEYHDNFNFTPLEHELVIVDEADCFIFADPYKFHQFISESCCLCFTATPDNQDPQGIERKILEKMQINRYSYSLEDDNPQSKQGLELDDTIQWTTIDDQVNYIVEKSNIGPVLVYCNEELQQKLLLLGDKSTLIQPGVDHQQLRRLDQMGKSGYQILISDSTFGMRGIDYRSPKATITLVIAQSFPHKRDAIQGYNRVGRFGDAAARVIFKGVELIDQKATLTYKSKLIQFLGEMGRNKVSLKQVQVKKVNPPKVKSGTYQSKLGQKRSQQLIGQSLLTFKKKE